MLRHIGIPGQAANAYAGPVRQFLDLREWQSIDVDELRWTLDAHFHEVDQVGAATEELRGRVHCDRVGSLLGISRPRISERVHTLFDAACLMASTMFGYAPQRQRLPLIH